ncbi:MAG: sodium:proton antiporter NhaD [Bacteroidia bacterium]|nr:sodium:proton antiporter NhaD [Bacteroidia bacterium]
MSTLLITVFITTYFFIIIEDKIKISKSAIALTGGILMWLIIFLEQGQDLPMEGIYHALEEIASVLFFLLGAMTTVEVIDIHGGFEYITQKISRLRPSALFFWISMLAFILSSFLDNLTTTVLMASLLSKTVSSDAMRKYTLACVVPAANAGGVFSPIGDVTSTMLWISERLSSMHMILTLIIPSLVCFFVPYLYTRRIGKKNKWWNEQIKPNSLKEKNNSSLFILIFGIFMLLTSPILKTTAGLPPFAGMLLGLGTMWVISEIIERRRPEMKNTVANALARIDTPGILFFFGILMAVSALGYIGTLREFSEGLSRVFSDYRVLHFFTGIISAVLDNVPLVAGLMEMYPLEMYPTDHAFWNLLCYSSGTGGSLLIIGSAAGVIAMNSEKISFTWYLKHMTFPIFLGYLAGYLMLIFMI